MRKGFHLGLVGWPLAHSLSPALHRAALHACDMDGSYTLYPVAALPQGQEPLAELLQQVRAGELDGLNVTIPHKLSVLPLLDELTPTARMVGAVNTITRDGSTLVGENTDVFGFLDDIKQHISLAGGGRALVFGAGGAARAIVYALLSQGWQVLVAARKPGQAQALAATFRHLQPAPIALPQGLSAFESSLAELSVQLIVNATPLGMPPYEHASPWPTNVHLPANCFVYDLVYHPQETGLLRLAKAQGLRSANGLGMLIYQAARAFCLWTHQPVENLSLVENAMQSAILIEKGNL